MLDATKALLHPTASSFSMIKDRISFVYLEYVRAIQDATGVVAVFRSRDQVRRVQLPIASISVVMLGPGSSITSPACASLSRAGATLLVTEGAATRTIAWGHSTVSDARWAEAQARLWADPAVRLETAKRLYLMRYNEIPPGPVTIERLRGLEGARVKSLYGQLARRAGMPNWRRHWAADDTRQIDPVNQALSAANACLYGVATAAITGIGALPQLGFIHGGGGTFSFVYDIADLYKAQSSIPIAFACKDEPNPTATARRRMREYFKDEKLIAKIVGDVQTLLTPGLPATTAPGLNEPMSDRRAPIGRNWAWISGDQTDHLSGDTSTDEVSDLEVLSIQEPPANETDGPF